MAQPLITLDQAACCPAAEPTLLTTDNAERLSALFKALADPTRVRLLAYLASSTDGTVCACHLPDALGISQPTMSFHLKKLHEAGLVEREQRGRWAHWTVQPEALAVARSYLGSPGCC